MKKSHQISICIGKCFNKSMLTTEDIECSEDLSYSDFIIDHGLNQDQADCVIKWIKQECQRIQAQKSLHPNEE